MIISNFEPFVGVHCETTATGSLLKHDGIELSEAMMFGLGQGLNYIYWNSKQFDFPFIGGRCKPRELSKSLANNLNIKYNYTETTSSKKAWRNVQQLIDDERPVGLQLDSYHLEYFGIKTHFAGHFVTMWGYDNDYAYLVDTQPNGGKVKTSLSSLEQARSEKGPMSAKNLAYWFTHSNNKELDLSKAIINATFNNAIEYINPPIKNIGYKGIEKTSVELIKCFRASKNKAKDVKLMAMLMEEAGTGGSIFRNIYRDYLKEASNITGIEQFDKSYQAFKEIALDWKAAIKLIEQSAEDEDENLIVEACNIIAKISGKEYEAMSTLTTIKESAIKEFS